MRLVDELLYETINLGGVAMTRKQALVLLQNEGHSNRAIDYAVWAKTALNKEETLRLIPYSHLY